jgi:hypothetical protein
MGTAFFEKQHCKLNSFPNKFMRKMQAHHLAAIHRIPR